MIERVINDVTHYGEIWVHRGKLNQMYSSDYRNIIKHEQLAYASPLACPLLENKYLAEIFEADGYYPFAGDVT